MSNIIQLLERMGQDASLQSFEQQQIAINESNLDERTKQSLSKNELIELKKELDICPDIYCVFFPAEDEPKQDESEESPAEDADEVKLIANA
ncbi:hypothetical protein MSG37_07105 [Shewanella sp. 1CM18E]|uniref:hypothetical protein n=1 Tax=Shewanella sp. 1CM18E TaxID=2929169 RepID=UPI0020C04F97|nr:hypothetical protein [Shewanella sp. 1CM18E]MCK8044648.1 hypothetical protein [Shewanella sp. 1CM18E]